MGGQPGRPTWPRHMAAPRGRPKWPGAFFGALRCAFRNLNCENRLQDRLPVIFARPGWSGPQCTSAVTPRATGRNSYSYSYVRSGVPGPPLSAVCMHCVHTGSAKSRKNYDERRREVPSGACEVRGMRVSIPYTTRTKPACATLRGNGRDMGGPE